jgi:hypothetical protein
VSKPINCKHLDAKLGPKLRAMHEKVMNSDQDSKHIEDLQQKIIVKIQEDCKNLHVIATEMMSNQDDEYLPMF